MSANPRSILEAALSLPPDDRAEIAERLMFSLDDRHRAEIEAAWDAELQRRANEVDRGDVALIPRDEAMPLFRQRMRALVNQTPLDRSELMP
jgi:putative addiction module component (TIGR02574 family)